MVECLEEICDVIEDVIQDSFDEWDICLWVIQFFCQDEIDVIVYLDRLCGYIKFWVQGSVFIEDYLWEIEGYMCGIVVL